MKRVLQGLLLVVGLLAGLIIAEAAVRFFAPHSRDHITPPGLFAIDATLGWKLQPRYTRRHVTRYFDVEYAINRLGYRGRDRSLPEKDSVRRLLLFGDSQVFGWGVPVGQRFSDVAETNASNLEIWNRAVPGYGLDQQVISYLETPDSPRADGAIFYVSKATLRRMRSSALYRKPKPRFTLDSTGRAVLDPIVVRSTAITDGLYRHFSSYYLPYFVETQLGRLFNRNGVAELDHRSDVPVDSASMALAKAILLRAREKASEKGHELFLIAALPRESLDHLARFAGAHGMTLISTGWPAPPAELMFGPSDHHWTPRLHEELGQRLAPVLAPRAH